MTGQAVVRSTSKMLSPKEESEEVYSVKIFFFADAELNADKTAACPEDSISSIF
ncbi:hypothetical protein D3C84_1168420 [compost metagenome]